MRSIFWHFYFLLQQKDSFHHNDVLIKPEPFFQDRRDEDLDDSSGCVLP
ncbi:MAG: hypothetical protein SFW66_08180 [Gammaproteobacteria bacterium]|nr:hypothetical protein [Gammaproteobacteria bacterium]